MFELSWEAASVIIAVLILLVGIAAAWGTIRERVKNQGREIAKNRGDIEKFIEENRESHKKLHNELNEVCRQTSQILGTLNGRKNS